jgi:hypothetical protein
VQFKVILLAAILVAPHPTLGAQPTAIPDSASGREPQKTFFTRRDLGYSALALAGSALVSRFDVRIAHWSQRESIQGSESRQELIGSLTRVNELPLTVAAAATYGVGRLAAPVLYTAALIPGFTRIHLDEHWASDVIAGGFVGALLGSRVVQYAHAHRTSKLDRALLGLNVVPTGDGAMAVVTFAP